MVKNEKWFSKKLEHCFQDIALEGCTGDPIQRSCHCGAFKEELDRIGFSVDELITLYRYADDYDCTDMQKVIIDKLKKTRPRGEFKELQAYYKHEAIMDYRHKCKRGLVFALAI